MIITRPGRCRSWALRSASPSCSCRAGCTLSSPSSWPVSSTNTSNTEGNRIDCLAYIFNWSRSVRSIQRREGVGRRHQRTGTERRAPQPPAAPGRSAAHQELAAADPHSVRKRRRAQAQAAQVARTCLSIESWQRVGSGHDHSQGY